MTHSNSKTKKPSPAGKVQWLSDIHDAQANIRECVEELRYLSAAFGITGNKEIANQLNGIGNDLLGDDKMIGDAIGVMLSEQIKESGDNLNTIFMSALKSVTEEE